jgi:hypothetical protein
VRGKIFILVIMLIFLIYGSSIIYVQAKYPGYDNRYRPLLGGIQIVIPYYYYLYYCSLAFPVNFKKNGNQKYGFIKAGHCSGKKAGGGDVYQPTVDQNNFIGSIIRNSYGVDSRADAALIRIEGSGNENGIGKHIYENGNLYFGNHKPDNDGRVGILDVRTPFKEMELNENYIQYKSGRTTGLTYGIVIQYDYYAKYPDGDLYPALLISRCKNSSNCYYNTTIVDRGDSGGPVYDRILIYQELGGALKYYGAIIYGLVTGRDPSKPQNDTRYMVASWATKVKEIWPDISFITCGSGSSCW